METTIQIPKGFVIDSVDMETGEVKFKPITDSFHIKTMEEVLSSLGEDDPDVQDYRKLLYGVDDAHHLAGYQKAILIVKALNQGWVPNWDNSSEYKYSPWFYMQGGSSGFRFHGYGDWSSHSYVGSRLCFKTSELAEHAGKHFTEVYKQFMI